MFVVFGVSLADVLLPLVKTWLILLPLNIYFNVGFARMNPLCLIKVVTYNLRNPNALSGLEYYFQNSEIVINLCLYFHLKRIVSFVKYLQRDDMPEESEFVVFYELQ